MLLDCRFSLLHPLSIKACDIIFHKEGILKKEAEELNRVFIKNMKEKLLMCSLLFISVLFFSMQVNFSEIDSSKLTTTSNNPTLDIKTSDTEATRAKEQTKEVDVTNNELQTISISESGAFFYEGVKMEKGKIKDLLKGMKGEKIILAPHTKASIENVVFIMDLAMRYKVEIVIESLDLKKKGENLIRAENLILKGSNNRTHPINKLRDAIIDLGLTKKEMDFVKINNNIIDLNNTINEKKNKTKNSTKEVGINESNLNSNSTNSLDTLPKELPSSASPEEKSKLTEVVISELNNGSLQKEDLKKSVIKLLHDKMNEPLTDEQKLLNEKYKFDTSITTEKGRIQKRLEERIQKIEEAKKAIVEDLPYSSDEIDNLIADATSLFEDEISLHQNYQKEFMESYQTQIEDFQNSLKEETSRLSLEGQVLLENIEEIKQQFNDLDSDSDELLQELLQKVNEEDINNKTKIAPSIFTLSDKLMEKLKQDGDIQEGDSLSFILDADNKTLIINDKKQSNEVFNQYNAFIEELNPEVHKSVGVIKILIDGLSISSEIKKKE